MRNLNECHNMAEVTTEPRALSPHFERRFNSRTTSTNICTVCDNTTRPTTLEKMVLSWIKSLKYLKLVYWRFGSVWNNCWHTEIPSTFTNLSANFTKASLSLLFLSFVRRLYVWKVCDSAKNLNLKFGFVKVICVFPWSAREDARA